jgi:lipoprotein-anchoring transpeptidase ErfK/SrfK
VTQRHIHISIAEQRLRLLDGERIVFEAPVSTAANGPGEENGSGCTPRGRHIVRAKIGSGCEPGTVFVGRRPTGERYSEELAQQTKSRDWILSRILWLSGSEPGCNRLGNVDSMRRYIYIHGTPDSEPMGTPRSHGCVRMRNDDIIALFDMVAPGTPVLITEESFKESA